jgi:septal ring factor EnvC (AmiA/AmiB activator)
MSNSVYIIKCVESIDVTDHGESIDNIIILGYFSGSKEELYELLEKQEEKIEEAKANYFDWSFKRRIYFDEIKETQKNLEKSIRNAREERRNLFASLLELSKQDGKDEERKKTSEALDANDKQLTLLSSDLSKMEKTDHESRLRIFLETNPEPKNYPHPTSIDFEELKEFKGL